MFLTNTLSLYLTRKFLMSILLVFVTCISLILLIDFVELLRRTGDLADVTLFQVFGLALLRLPSFTEQMFPFAVLFGTMGALLRLSQKLELVIVRSAGVSVWQFLAPALLVALLIGAFGTLVYNPLAAETRERADKIEAALFGKITQGATLQTTAAGLWIRQDGEDGQFILNAQSALEQGLDLRGVVIYLFDSNGNFQSRIDSKQAQLKKGYWKLTDSLITRHGESAEKYETFELSTKLTPDQVRESLASLDTISFYDLPSFIELAEQAGLPATRLRLQYQTLMARPWLLAAMTLIAATVSLRLFRLGQVMPMILGGVGAGFLLYVTLEIAKQLGRSGLIDAVYAAWSPVVVAMLTGLTILLYQEDG